MTRLRNLWGKIQGRGWLLVLLAIPAVLLALPAIQEALCSGWGLFDEKARDEGACKSDSLSDLVLVLAAVIGLLLAGWRSVVANEQAKIANEQAKIANRQAETANEQAKIANRQADTSERGLRNERYQKGADMLGSATLATRMGGIYALERLAQDHPEDYHVQIMQLLCAFARHPTESEGARAVDSANDATNSKHADQGCPTDVEAAIRAVSECRKRLSGQGGLADIEASLRLNLSGANLSGANLSGADLTNANLPDANLSRANLRDAILYNTILHHANLSGADLTDANLSRANFLGAALLGANLTDANLNGANLNGALLDGANLNGAALFGADFNGAALGGADLTGAGLTEADLSGALGLTQEMLRSAQPFPPPKSLPEGLVWPLEKGEDGAWRLKPVP
ncbi:MAG: pentapeptide repeat-containing protein [Rhodospirillales bacterium]|nr:pentapeptide repeat-containing protein [Rhodospirillales bacterium]